MWLHASMFDTMHSEKWLCGCMPQCLIPCIVRSGEWIIRHHFKFALHDVNNELNRAYDIMVKHLYDIQLTKTV